MNVQVNVRIDGVSPEEIVKRLSGAEFHKMLKQTAKDMADQGRINIIAHGKPGGDWPQLSGFNARRNAKRQAKEDAKGRAVSTGSELARNRRISSDTSKNNAHSGYAKRKADGKTPGKGKHGPGDRLKDTGSLYKTLVGEIEISSTWSEVSMTATGKIPGRPTDAELLEYHAAGTETLPVRNPAQDMTSFEQRTQRRLEELLGATGASVSASAA